MGTEGNGLTLEGLAHRLETLERENTELRSKIATLENSGKRRHEVPALRGSDRHGDKEAGPSESDGLVSRRSLLSKAGAAAVAAMAAGTLLKPREANAHHSNQRLDVDSVKTHFLEVNNLALVNTRSDSLPSVHAKNYGNAEGVVGVNFNAGTGVLGVAEEYGGTGVRGIGSYGVVGLGGGSGSASHYAGVFGRNSDGDGVRGEGSTQAEAAGVRGLGKTGVLGTSSTFGYSGVYGEHTGSLGYGVVGDGAGNASGVLGRNNTGTGVLGKGSYGGWFEGSKAQLLLKPADTKGKPGGEHTKGEIYMDSAGTLFVCVKGGTTTTWRKVTTTAV